MLQAINFTDFTDAFNAHGRRDQFTYAGLRALFDYLECLEDDTGEPIELDVIALCCDFTEWESLEEIQAAYTDIESIADLHDNTTVIEFGVGQYIIQDY